MSEPEKLIDSTVIVRGAGDLGSGVLLRLWRFGFQPVALERSEPVTVRRQVAFASAVYQDEITIEGIHARRVQSLDAQADIPVLVDEQGERLKTLNPRILVDATMVRDPGKIQTNIDQAPLTIGLGPGFEAGNHVDYVIETNRGHRLGRVIEKGRAQEASGEPGEILGYTHERVLRAPASGIFESDASIGDQVEKDQQIGTVNGAPVRAELDGVIRGLIQSGITAHEGMKIGDVDPRGNLRDVPLVSDKALAVGGGVLEAIGHHFYRKESAKFE